jgi:hypothetical protein
MFSLLVWRGDLSSAIYGYSNPSRPSKYNCSPSVSYFICYRLLKEFEIVGSVLICKVCPAAVRVVSEEPLAIGSVERAEGDKIIVGVEAAGLSVVAGAGPPPRPPIVLEGVAAEPPEEPLEAGIEAELEPDEELVLGVLVDELLCEELPLPGETLAIVSGIVVWPDAPSGSYVDLIVRGAANTFYASGLGIDHTNLLVSNLTLFVGSNDSPRCLNCAVALFTAGLY